MAGDRWQRARDWASRNRFRFLLVSLVLLILFSPIASYIRTPAHPEYSGLLTSLLYALILAASTLASSSHRVPLIFVGLGGLIAVVLLVTNTFHDSNQLLLAHNLLILGILSYIIGIGINGFLISKTVTMETIAASLCVYLMIGIAFAMGFSMVQRMDPSSFVVSTGNPSDLVEFASSRSVVSLYFSFITLTTLGYGDVTPANPFARMLTSVEAIIGQLYLAVLVARLVGLHIASESRGQSNKPRSEVTPVVDTNREQD